jgi:hypothetical protein
LWWSVLLVEETGAHRENHWPAASQWQTLSHKWMLYWVHGTPHLNGIEVTTSIRGMTVKQEMTNLKHEIKIHCWTRKPRIMKNKPKQTRKWEIPGELIDFKTHLWNHFRSENLGPTDGWWSLL